MCTQLYAHLLGCRVCGRGWGKGSRERLYVHSVRDLGNTGIGVGVGWGDFWLPQQLQVFLQIRVRRLGSGQRGNDGCEPHVRLSHFLGKEKKGKPPWLSPPFVRLAARAPGRGPSP